ncbi:MAG: hypothetical protein AB8G23_04145 [Myxococcota bacterium]
MRVFFATSLIAAGLLIATSASAGGPNETVSDRRSHHASPTLRVDAAVDAIVRELAAVGAGPRETTVSAPGADRLEAGSLRRLGSLADEAAAARKLTEADEGEDDHAM